MSSQSNGTSAPQQNGTNGTSSSQQTGAGGSGGASNRPVYAVGRAGYLSDIQAQYERQSAAQAQNQPASGSQQGTNGTGANGVNGTNGTNGN